MALVAPAEYLAGRDGLGLHTIHALTVPGMVEGFLILAFFAGRLVPLALALTAGSMLLGVLRSATDHGTHGLDRLALAQSIGITTAAVIVLAGAHHIRQHALTLIAHAHAHAATAAAAAEEARTRADLERARLADQRAADELAAAERAQAAERAHVLELQRARAYAEEARTRADLERARLADQRAADDAARTEQARAAERAHELALAEAAARAPERARTTSARAPRAQTDGERDDLAEARAERERAHATWLARENTDKPMTGAELAHLLGVHESTGRRTAEQWRAEQAHAAEGTR